MSRETLLDEAIAKAKEAGDWQLVEWLRMARGGESAARWYTKNLQEERDENDKLRELVRDMADAIVDWYDLIDGAFACESVYVDEKFASLFDRMRELGVEP